MFKYKVIKLASMVLIGKRWMKLAWWLKNCPALFWWEGGVSFDTVAKIV